jgi:hypothetical protein
VGTKKKKPHRNVKSDEVISSVLITVDHSFPPQGPTREGTEALSPGVSRDPRVAVPALCPPRGPVTITASSPMDEALDLGWGHRLW